PIEHAFEAHHAESPCSAEVLSDLRASSVTFSAGLREIPRQAQCIQRDLNRSVWNGSVRLSRRATSNANFAKALLREISAMGRKTKEVFERSIEELHETAVSSILHESRFMASVAVELLARAFHKRAVDCRRWARHRAFVNALSGKHDTELPVDTVLRQLGSLYTDCYSVVLFDAEGRV